MKKLKISEIESLLKSLKSSIDNDCRAYEEDTLPSMLVTIGANDSGNWKFQTGDNSFSGGAYGFPYWGVVALYRRSNCRELARDVINQIEGAS